MSLLESGSLFVALPALGLLLMLAAIEALDWLAGVWPEVLTWARTRLSARSLWRAALGLGFVSRVRSARPSDLLPAFFLDPEEEKDTTPVPQRFYGELRCSHSWPF